MSDYEITNSTVSFLQFDDPNDILKDSIINNQTKWNKENSNTKTLSLVKTKRISKPYSLQLYSFYETYSGPWDDYKVYYYGGIQYSYQDTGIFESSFTLDFWCSNINETGISIDYILSDPDYMNDYIHNNKDSVHYSNSPKEYMLFYMANEVDIKINSSTASAINKLQISDPESNKYNHIAITFDAKTKKISFFYNGKLFVSNTCPDLEKEVQEFISTNEYYTNHYFKFDISADLYRQSREYATSLIDNVRLSNKVLWDKDFDPPGINCKQLLYNNGNAYGVINGESKILSSNWDLLAEDQKISIINSLDYDILPSPEEMTKFIDEYSFSDINSKVYSFQKEMKTKNLVIEENDHKESELVLPKKLIDIDTFGTNIIQANPKYTISTSSNSTIKIAVTEDLKYYKTFNFTNKRWELIDSSEIETKGIDISQLAAITEDFWTQLGTDIAFGYCLIRNSNADTVSMDELDFKMNLSKYWKEANFDTQVKYQYCSPSNLRIIFKESGDYKIIYREQKLEEGDN